MRQLDFLTKIKLIAGGLLVLAVSAPWFYTRHNVTWSARVAWGEARGEPEGGMQAVLNVMANRRKDPRFPKSLSGVAKQPRQFSAYNDGDPNRQKLEAVADDDPQFRRALRLATWAQVGLLPDITGGATHFHSNNIARPAYLTNAKVSAVIGHHIFYTGAERAD
jgi:cell wall hydrolase